MTDPTDKPKTERLAQWLDDTAWSCEATSNHEYEQAAAELRRLSAVEAERDALRVELWDARREHDITRGNLELTRLGCDELQAQVARLEADRADDEKTREMMRDILSRTAIALRGPEPEGTRWGWADLPERVARLEADARRWEYWRNYWPALCRMEVARFARLDLRTTYVQGPADMDKVTDAAIDAAAGKEQA